MAQRLISWMLLLAGLALSTPALAQNDATARMTGNAEKDEKPFMTSGDVPQLLVLGANMAYTHGAFRNQPRSVLGGVMFISATNGYLLGYIEDPTTGMVIMNIGTQGLLTAQAYQFGEIAFGRGANVRAGASCQITCRKPLPLLKRPGTYAAALSVALYGTAFLTGRLTSGQASILDVIPAAEAAEPVPQADALMTSLAEATGAGPPCGWLPKTP